MNNENILKESFIDDLLKKVFPTAHKNAEEKYLKKKSKKLQKLEKDLASSQKKVKKYQSDFEKAWEEDYGKKLNLDDYSIDDLLNGKHLK